MDIIVAIWAKFIFFISRIKVIAKDFSVAAPAASYIGISNHRSNFGIKKPKTMVDS